MPDDLGAADLRPDEAPPDAASPDGTAGGGTAAQVPGEGGTATRAVGRAVTSAVETVFSYRDSDTAATRAAAQRLLTGPAIRQYNSLFALVEKEAPAERLVVRTTVSNVGVEFFAGNRARVLIFASQQDTRAGTKAGAYSGAMFAVTAVHRDGRWLIESIDAFAPGG